MQKLPQQLVNVEVKQRELFKEAKKVQLAIDRENAFLEGRGRVLVRPSGTEPLIRVMVEAPTENEATDVCGRLVQLVKAELNGES